MAGRPQALAEFELEYQLAKEVVVFSHGFGVDRTSRGLFTDIIANLPEDTGYVLFDYYRIEEGAVGFTTFAEQQERLRQVIEWVEGQPDVKRYHLIGHSMGCVVISLLQPIPAGRVLFLAPPLQIGERTRKHFTGKTGAYQEGMVWIVPRSDGSTSRIREAMFAEIESIDARAAVLAYAQKHPIIVIDAGNDEVLGEENRQDLEAEGVGRRIVEIADHNFSGTSRQVVIDLVRTQLLS